MEPLFEKLISTGGPSVVVVLCVWIMLKHMADQAELNRQLFREIHGEHLTARKESQDVIRENSVVMREFAVASQKGNR